MLTKSDKYGRGSAAANGEGFADLAPGDTFAALETQLKRRIAERFDNVALGISATIGSNRNASELAKHLASGEEEEPHKFAAKNIGVLFARGRIAFSHGDKKAVAGQRWVTRFIRVFTSFQFAGRRYLATLTLKDVDPDRKLYAVEAVEINQDAKSRSTPRGAMSEDLNSAPFQDLTSQLREMVAYYVGDVNRTRPQFVGSPEPFSVERTAVLLETMMRDSGLGHPASSIPRLAPAFSVVIPAYNVAPYLRECLESVACAAANVEKLKSCNVEKLGGVEVEVICVDDGSTDGSGAILDEYASRFNSSTFQPFNLKVIHQPNRGEGGARNAALDVATGEWLCFLDGDDLFSPDMLTAGAKLIRENPDCDIVRVGAAVFADGDGPRQAKPFRRGLLNGVFCTGLYRRSKFGDARFTDFLVGADRVYAASCVFRTGRIAECKAVGYLYRQRTTSISHVRMTPRKAQDSFLHVAEMLKIAAACGKTPDPRFRRQLVAQVLEEGASNCLKLAPAERPAVEGRWRACVADLRERGLLTPWGTFVANVLRILPLDASVFFLCVMPYRLKRMGLHR